VRFWIDPEKVEGKARGLGAAIEKECRRIGITKVNAKLHRVKKKDKEKS
jgi:hypothetical protein